MKILCCYAPEDTQHLLRLGQLLEGHDVKRTDRVLNRAELAFILKKGEFDACIICHEAMTDVHVKDRFTNVAAKDLPSSEHYAGSLIQIAGMPVLYLPSLERLVDSNYGRFLYERYLKKILKPDDPDWQLRVPAFSYSVFGESSFRGTANDLLQRWSRARAIAIDIETLKEGLQISCVGYTALFLDPNTKAWTHETVVVPFTDMFAHALVRQINALPAPKILQNGKYDSAYLLRWGCPLVNWLWDTQSMFHCWYSELPKRLDFIASFMLRDIEYWKHESKTGNTADVHMYNAKDVWSTAAILLKMLEQLPEWAMQNYLMEFPLNMPSLWAEMVGCRCDMSRLETVQAQKEAEVAAELAQIRRRLGLPGFNPRSPKHMLALFEVLGAKGLKSAAEKHLIKVTRLHPLNELIIGQIQKYKKSAKLLSTYLVPEKFLNGRILWSIVPHGTDTGRQASKEHHFWCGLQIQNIPRGDAVKQLFIAEDDWHLGEADGEQAEARYVGYLSGDRNLIQTVESDKDFHSLNAERFFGVPYEQIIDEYGKVIDKILRDLSKRVNHGANYNMGAAVLLETMGVDKVFKAKKVLGLPPGFSAMDVCKFLLARYEEAYPMVKSVWYGRIVGEVQRTHVLTGATGWTRYCFGTPWNNKPDLNAYVAHVPQSLNAMVLNKGFMRVFEQIQLVYPEHFRILAQIHDSILFTYRVGYEALALKVKELMEIPVKITGADEKTRTMTVPVALKYGKARWSELGT